MCYGACALLLSFFVVSGYAGPVNDQSVNLNLETVLEFNKRSVESDVKIIDNVQKFLSKVKGVLDETVRGKVLGSGRRSNRQRMTFSDFLQRVLQVLAKFDEDYLRSMIAIFDDEARRYHYKGCKFYELVHHPALRKQISYSLNEMKKIPPRKLKENISRWQKKFQQNDFTDVERELYEFLDTLYDKNSSREMFDVLDNLESYRRQGEKMVSTEKIVKIIRGALRNIIFDHYSSLNSNVRKDLKLKMASYFILHDSNGQIIKLGQITKLTDKPYKNDQANINLDNDTDKEKQIRKNTFDMLKQTDLKHVDRDAIGLHKLKDDVGIRFISLYTEKYVSKVTKPTKVKEKRVSNTEEHTSKTTTSTENIATDKPRKRRKKTTTPSVTEKKQRKHKYRKESKSKNSSPHKKSRHHRSKKKLSRQFRDEMINKYDSKKKHTTESTLPTKMKKRHTASILPKVTLIELDLSGDQEVLNRAQALDVDDSENKENIKQTQLPDFSDGSENRKTFKRTRLPNLSDMSGSREVYQRARPAEPSDVPGKRKDKGEPEHKRGKLLKPAFSNKSAKGSAKNNMKRRDRTSRPLHEFMLEYNAVVQVKSSPSLKGGTAAGIKDDRSQTKMRRNGENIAPIRLSYDRIDISKSIESAEHAPKEHKAKRPKTGQRPDFGNMKSYKNKRYNVQVPRPSYGPDKNRIVILKRSNIQESDISSRGMSIESFEREERLSNHQYRKTIDVDRGVDAIGSDKIKQMHINDTKNDQLEDSSSNPDIETTKLAADENVEDLEMLPTDSEEEKEAFQSKMFKLDTEPKEINRNEINKESKKLVRSNNIKAKEEINKNQETTDAIIEYKNLKTNEALNKNNITKGIKFENLKVNDEINKNQKVKDIIQVKEELTKNGESEILKANEALHKSAKSKDTKANEELNKNGKSKEHLIDKHDEKVPDRTEAVREDVNMANQEFLIKRIWNLEHEMAAVKHKIATDEAIHRSNDRYELKDLPKLDTKYVTKTIYTDSNVKGLTNKDVFSKLDYEVSTKLTTGNRPASVKKFIPSLVDNKPYLSATVGSTTTKTTTLQTMTPHTSSKSRDFTLKQILIPKGVINVRSNTTASSGSTSKATVFKQTEVLIRNQKSSSKVLTTSALPVSVNSFYRLSSNVIQKDKDVTFSNPGTPMQRNFGKHALVPIKKEVNDTPKKIKTNTTKAIITKRDNGIHDTNTNTTVYVKTEDPITNVMFRASNNTDNNHHHHHHHHHHQMSQKTSAGGLPTNDQALGKDTTQSEDAVEYFSRVFKETPSVYDDYEQRKNSLGTYWS